MISPNTVRSHLSHPSQTNPRIKAAAARCAAQIKAATEAHEEAITLTGFLRIAAAYKTFQREVAEIEQGEQ